MTFLIVLGSVLLIALAFAAYIDLKDRKRDGNGGFRMRGRANRGITQHETLMVNPNVGDTGTYFDKPNEPR
jgi:hypothetical protein